MTAPSSVLQGFLLGAKVVVKCVKPPLMMLLSPVGDTSAEAPGEWPTKAGKMFQVLRSRR